jgi:hypothetical protein
MTWIYENEPVSEVDPQYIGFIYCITNLLDGRRYIGKKKSTFKKTSIKTIKLKNGEKRKKKIRSLVPSDWDTYYGSSEELKKDVETLGKENFKREITRWCRTLSELTYFEAREQFVTDCLLYPDKFYNAWISCRTRRDHLLKFTQIAPV